MHLFASHCIKECEKDYFILEYEDDIERVNIPFYLNLFMSGKRRTVYVYNIFSYYFTLLHIVGFRYVNII